MGKKKVGTDVTGPGGGLSGVLNSILPGPTHKATNTYSDGSKSTGYGNSKTSAKKSADKAGRKKGWW